MSRIYQTPNTAGSRLDLRYSYRKEFCGRAGLAYVARFCGDCIGTANTADEIRLVISAHQASREN